MMASSTPCGCNGPMWSLTSSWGCCTGWDYRGTWVRYLVRSISPAASPKITETRHMNDAYQGRGQHTGPAIRSASNVWALNETTLRAYVRPLTNMLSLKCLGRLLADIDDDWPTVVVNLWNSRKRWARMSSIIGREGVDAQTSGNFFEMVI